jgi:hypothetical protein
MGKDTKVVAHEGIGFGTCSFYKRGYGEWHCSTLSVGYSLPSLRVSVLEKSTIIVLGFVLYWSCLEKAFKGCIYSPPWA